MDNLKSYLRTIPDFEKAYQEAKEQAREINFAIDALELDPKSNADIIINIDNNFYIGLDKETLTIWVFYNYIQE